MTVVWTDWALRDLESARAFIAAENPAAAGRVAARIREAGSVLGAHPEIGRVGKVAGTRELVVAGTPFFLVYRLGGRRVEVLALVHGAQRWPD